MKSWLARIAPDSTMTTGEPLAFSFRGWSSPIDVQDRIFAVGRRDPAILYGWGAVIGVSREERLVIGDDEEANSPPYPTYEIISVTAICKQAFVLPLSLSAYLSPDDFDGFWDGYSGSQDEGILKELPAALVNRLGRAIGAELESSMKVFICYGREDVAAANRLHNALVSAGCEVWFDKESLLAGQIWEEAIVGAIRSSDAVCAVLSRSSVGRRGFVNREIAEALKVVDELPQSRPFLIPVRLEECDPSHRRLSELHRVDMFPDWDDGLRQILKALQGFGQSREIAEQLPVRAFVQIRLGDGRIAETMAAVKSVPGIVSVDATLGPFDLMVVLDGSKDGDLADRVNKLHEIAGVGSTSTHVIVPRK